MRVIQKVVKIHRAQMNLTQILIETSQKRRIKKLKMKTLILRRNNQIMRIEKAHQKKKLTETQNQMIEKIHTMLSASKKTEVNGCL